VVAAGTSLYAAQDSPGSAEAACTRPSTTTQPDAARRLQAGDSQLSRRHPFGSLRLTAAIVANGRPHPLRMRSGGETPAGASTNLWAYSVRAPDRTTKAADPTAQCTFEVSVAS
jgi:hypothetical protein